MRGSIGKGLAAAVLAVLAGGTGLAAAPAARATPSPFPSCDGHAPPKGRGDGLAISDSWISPRDPDPVQIRDQALGVAGDEACTAALEDTALSPAMRARRASLLQARALHRLAGGDTAGALADLDGADAAVAGEADPFVARSLGISLALARARVLAERGDASAARELALKAWRQRPYDAKVAIVTAMVLAAAAPPGSAPSEDERALLARCAQLRPRLATPALAGLLAASPAAAATWRPTLALGSPALALFDDLPAPEAQAMAAPWAEARRGALTGRGSITDRNLQGFRLTEHPELGTVTAEFRARGATADLVEEGALLAAANAALAAGKPGFIVLDGGDTDLYENNSYYGVVLSTRLTNRTTVLEILPVDPKALPAAHGADGWRVLDAAAVRAALAPLFPPPAPRG